MKFALSLAAKIVVGFCYGALMANVAAACSTMTAVIVGGVVFVLLEMLMMQLDVFIINSVADEDGEDRGEP